MSPIPAADPQAAELDGVFAAAMSGPARPRSEPKAPKEINPEAPFGLEDDGITPKTPYGRTSDGRIKRSAGGRPKNGKGPDAARVTDKPAALPATTGDTRTPAEASKDYTKDIADAASGIWLMLTSASKLPLGRLRIGRYGLPVDAQDKIAAQAYVFHAHEHRLAAALNEAAQHSARARRLAEALETGDISWVLTVGALTMPFATHTIALWRNDAAAMAELELPPIAELASSNERLMGLYMASLTESAAAVLDEVDAAAGQ